MRNLYIVIVLIFSGFTAASQCTTGYNAVALNWDYLDFVVSNGSYAPYITQAQSQTQKFSFGTQGVTVTHNYVTANTFGDVNTHTGEAGSFGAGDDLKFRDNGTVTFTFDQPVLNLRFSLYDIDRNQRLDISALNGAAGTNVNLATVGAGTILNISTNNAPSTRVQAASNSNVADNSSDGTVNVTVAGAVTSVTIAVSATNTNAGEDGSFYISDLSACSVGTLPTNYYNIARPFTNQPAYVVAVVDHTIYYVDVATGQSKLLFDDPAGFNINSMAYDSYNKIIYYTNSLTVNPTINRTIYKYDYNTGVKSVFVANINTLGIPTYYPGVESGAAAFYDGALYLGVEGAGQPSGASGSARSGYTNRESTIWKITLDASFNAVSAKQVYGLPVDNGAGNALHDWSDFGINDGMLYDFDGAASDLDIYQQNLLTGATVNYNNPVFNPRQTSVDWNGRVYNVGTPLASSTATIVPYLLNGTINSAQSYPITFNGTAISGSWGDAGEAFKPKTDFGDAPASYDPIPEPATHEIIPTLHLGTAVGIEFAKKTSANASGDGAEEDGVGGSQAIATGISNYGLMISVFNNTGANATLCGWIDRNGNGVYETGEGATAVVPSSALQQSIALTWPAINVTLPVSAQTFLRLRVTSAANGMTTANPTGYYNDGEVEDFPMIVTVVLPAHPVTLSADKINTDKVKLAWKIGNEEGYQSYELQKSKDGTNWSAINEKDAIGSVKEVSYIFTDVAPASPVSFYRVKILKKGGAFEYSNTSKIDFNSGNSIAVSPNPASSSSTVKIRTAIAAKAQLNIIDYTGRKVFDEAIRLAAGANNIQIPVIQQLSAGIYKVLVRIDNQVLSTSLVIIK